MSASNHTAVNSEVILNGYKSSIEQAGFAICVLYRDFAGRKWSCQIGERDYGNGLPDVSKPRKRALLGY